MSVRGRRGDQRDLRLRWWTQEEVRWTQSSQSAAAPKERCPPTMGHRTAGVHLLICCRGAVANSMGKLRGWLRVDNGRGQPGPHGEDGRDSQIPLLFRVSHGLWGTAFGVKASTHSSSRAAEGLGAGTEYLKLPACSESPALLWILQGAFSGFFSYTLFPRFNKGRSQKLYPDWNTETLPFF